MYTDAAVSVEEKGSVLTCSVFAIYLLFGLPSGIWDWTCLALIWASVCLLCTFVQLLWRKNHYNRLVNLSSCRGFLRRKIKGVCPGLPMSLRSVACCSCALAAQEHGPGWKSCCSASRRSSLQSPTAQVCPLLPSGERLLLKNTPNSCT